MAIKNEYIDNYGFDSLPHLKTAKQCGADVFLTTNQDLLKDRIELESKFGIKIRTPEELLKNGR